MTKDMYYQKGYASVNGLNLYYEIHGSGDPLLLLPDGFMTVEAMGEIVQQLAVLPSTTHVGWAPPYHGIMNRTELLLPIFTEFLDSSVQRPGELSTGT